MPMPHGTYLQTKKIEKIKLRASSSKQLYREHGAHVRHVNLTDFDIRAARNTSYLAYDFGEEPTDKGNRARKALGELVDQLNDLSEKMEELSTTHTEIGEPLFEYRAVTAGQTTISAVNVIHIAMACITLLMVLEKYLFGRSEHKS